MRMRYCKRQMFILGAFFVEDGEQISLSLNNNRITQSGFVFTGQTHDSGTCTFCITYIDYEIELG